MAAPRPVRGGPISPPPPSPPAPRPGALTAMRGSTNAARPATTPQLPPSRTTGTPTTTYKPWTGGGNDAWVGAPGDGGNIEYGVNRTRPPGPGPAPTPTQPMAPAYRGGGGGAPSSMRDVDWFNSDAIFRTGAGGAQVSLQEQLANLLFENQQGYQDIDRTRRDWGQQRDRGSRRTGEDFAARGLSQSGLYWQGLQDLLKDYEQSAGQINLREQNLAQQLGGRDPLSRLNAPAEMEPTAEGVSMAAEASPMATRSASPQGFTQGALFDQNYNALADVYGLLGQRGVAEGNRYQAGLNQMRAQSAGRSNQNIINTLGW